MVLNETYTLSNGVKIQKLGLGTWFIDDDKAADAVKDAVDAGYRLIDTAQAYGNERGVGEGVRNCGLKREDIFVGSKVAAEHKTYEEAYNEGKLKAIGVSNFQIEDIESLMETANKDHMKTNADVDFEISAEDMEILKNFKKIENYGANSEFPVYGGKL